MHMIISISFFRSSFQGIFSPLRKDKEMTLELGERLATPPNALRSKLREVVRRGRRLPAAIECWLEKRRSRRKLSELTDDELRDIGLTRAQATAEIAKSWFWS
ncbi:hypothetical protein RHECNPAF_890046 [Rhizobium etli CNPAF512]|nr:hypothetical protein RHECNPAF_890046 [Rhizobium etli CNPAF512]